MRYSFVLGLQIRSPRSAMYAYNGPTSGLEACMLCRIRHVYVRHMDTVLKLATIEHVWQHICEISEIV